MAKNEVAVKDKAGTEVGEVAPPAIASMYDAVSLQDIVLPRVYLQQPLSQGVQEGITKPGDLILGQGADDPVPVHLIGGDADEAVTMYVIGRERFAATTSGGGIEFHPDKKRDPSDPDSWEGWFFDVAIPSVDAAVPARWMLWKTAGAPAARAINTMIERKALAGDYEPLAIKVTVASKTNKRGQPFFAPKVAPAEADPADLDVARHLREVALTLRSNRTSENDAPEIGNAQPSFS